LFAAQLDLVAVMQMHLILEDVLIQHSFVGLGQALMVVFVLRAVVVVAVFA
jgi:hypothetical protein